MSFFTQEQTTELTLRDFEAAELAHATFRRTWRRQLPAVLLGFLLGALFLHAKEYFWGALAGLLPVAFLALYPWRLRRAALRKYGYLPITEHVVSFAYDDQGIHLAVGSEFRAAFAWKDLAAVRHFRDVYLFYPPSAGVELCHIVPARVIQSEADLVSTLTVNGVRLSNLG
jgi:hypothetical protein